MKLSIFDYTIYIDDNKDNISTKLFKKKIKNKYFEYINTIFNTCVGSQYGYKAQDVWDVEYELLSAMGCNEIKESPNFYNKVYEKESLTKYGFDWSEFVLNTLVNRLKWLIKKLSQSSNGTLTFQKVAALPLYMDISHKSLINRSFILALSLLDIEFFDDSC